MLEKNNIIMNVNAFSSKMRSQSVLGKHGRIDATKLFFLRQMDMEEIEFV